jgi:hypothetical protein
MSMLAMWFQETYTFSSGNAKLLLVFIGVVAVSMAVQAIVQISISLKGFKAVKDMAAAAEELKQKVLPLIETTTAVAKSTQALLHDTTPKIRRITDNLVETSNVVLETTNVVRASVGQLDKTVTDANLRTQRQVARVDGMVTAALTTTAEVMETVERGIRVPAQKIAVIAIQTKYVLEGLLDKIKSMAAKSPFFDGR